MEFSFLTTELGFAVEPLPTDQLQNQFQVRFVGGTTRVIVEGRSFGTSICVVLERLDGGWSRLVDILALRSPESAAPLLRFGDQGVLLRHAATVMRQHALDALRGEQEIFRAAEAHRQQMIEKSRGHNAA